MSRQELQRIRRRSEAQEIYARDSMTHQAALIGMLEANGFSYRDEAEIRRRLRRRYHRRSTSRRPFVAGRKANVGDCESAPRYAATTGSTGYTGGFESGWCNALNACLKTPLKFGNAFQNDRFLYKRKICPDEVKVILSGLFRCTSDKILVLPLEEFNEIILLKQDFDEIVCLCAYIETNGDAALLLQLYRYEMSDDDLLKNLVNISRNSHFSSIFRLMILMAGYGFKMGILILEKNWKPKKKDVFYLAASV